MFLSLFIAVIIVFAAVMLVMALGVIFSGKAIRGSCGGIAVLRTGERVLLPCEHCSPEEKESCGKRKQLDIMHKD